MTRYPIATHPTPMLAHRPIRDARERAGLTQQEAAARVGICQSRWSQIERGDAPSLPLARRITELFQNDLNTLFPISKSALE